MSTVKDIKRKILDKMGQEDLSDKDNAYLRDYIMNLDAVSRIQETEPIDFNKAMADIMSRSMSVVPGETYTCCNIKQNN